MTYTPLPADRGGGRQFALAVVENRRPATAAAWRLIQHHRRNNDAFPYAFDLIELNGDDMRRQYWIETDEINAVGARARLGRRAPAVSKIELEKVALCVRSAAIGADVGAELADPFLILIIRPLLDLHD
jgi:hypothetical protein